MEVTLNVKFVSMYSTFSMKRICVILHFIQTKLKVGSDNFYNFFVFLFIRISDIQLFLQRRIVG